jgi:signal peptidase II
VNTGVILTALGVIFSDRLTKIVVLSSLHQSQSNKVIPDIFYITLVMNDGVAFGMFKGRGALFIVLSAVICAAIIVYVVRRKDISFSMSLALGMILGGAIGNLADRVMFGSVIDFLDFRIWPVFNVADSFITIGSALLLWSMLRSRLMRTK